MLKFIKNLFKSKEKKIAEAEPVLRYETKTLIVQCTLNGKEIRTYNTETELQELPEGYNQRAILDCCEGRRNSYRGYLWKSVVLVILIN
jgi:hypothetical protein